jgi:segregation and condensation protein A
VDEPTIPQAAEFRIQLPSFEGPLDLLLHLIKKHELNILDLPIAFVTERYLDYLHMMQELDLDVASEYLLMAATLAHIKSKQLLPAAPSDGLEEQEDLIQEDPRAELIRRLLEYQKYKAVAEQLGDRPLAGRDVFQRGVSAPEAQGPAPLAEIDLYKLLDAFQAILKRVQGRVALEVTAERITIHERMTQLSDLLRARRSCLFEELFEGVRTRYEVVVTFLALLEMTKLRMTRVYQADPKSALHVQYALLDEESASIPEPTEFDGERRDGGVTDEELRALADVELGGDATVEEQLRALADAELAEAWAVEDEARVGQDRGSLETAMYAETQLAEPAPESAAQDTQDEPSEPELESTGAQAEERHTAATGQVEGADDGGSEEPHADIQSHREPSPADTELETDDVEPDDLDHGEETP